MISQWKNTNICISISVYSRTYGHINILSTETHMRMYPLLINQIRQCFLAYLKVFTLFAFLIERGKLFLRLVSFSKRIFKFKKVFSCVSPIVCGKFKTFTQIIRTRFIEKIVGYIIYELISPFTGR